jgi:hypothetical protein
VGRGFNMNDKKYRIPKMIVSNYVLFERVKDMIDKKYRKGVFNIKSPKEMEKLFKVIKNVFNNLEDPDGSLNTVTANRTGDFSKKLYDIANDFYSMKTMGLKM